MRTITMGLAVILLSLYTDSSIAGYRELLQEMEAYSPPTMIQSPSVRVPINAVAPDAFAIEKKNIEDAKKRWSRLISENPPFAADRKMSSTRVQTAVNDRQTLAILHESFSLAGLQNLILLRNPKIRGERARFQAALEGFDQVTQLDEILRQYSAFTESVIPGVGPMTGMRDDIKMKFPFPGVTALKGQLAEKNVEIEKQTLDMVQRDVVAQGIKAYWNLLYMHRALIITHDTLDQLNHLESVATTRYGAGTTSYQDVVKIRIGREKLEEQLDTLKKQKVNLETEILTLLDFPPGEALGPSRTITPDLSILRLETLYPQALEERQELVRMRAMIAKMERMVEMAETMIQPVFSSNYALFADQSVLQAGSDRTKPTFATAIATTRGKGLPKNPFFGTRDAYLRETRKKLEGLRSDLADAESRTRLLVRTAWFDLDRARRERSLFKDRLLELAQTSLDVSTRGYEAGSVSFADVIASYTGWLDINLASERRNSDVGVARAELDRLMGTLPMKDLENSGGGIAAETH